MKIIIKQSEKSQNQLLIDWNTFQIMIAGSNLEEYFKKIKSNSVNNTNDSDDSDDDQIDEDKITTLYLDNLIQGDSNFKLFFQMFDVYAHSFFKSDFENSVLMQNKYENFYEMMLSFPYPMIVNIIHQYTPPFIVELGLKHLYEQSIFYEYIYRSSLNLIDKIKCIVENDYSILLNLLENGILELCDETGDTDNLTFTEYYEKIFLDPKASSIYKRALVIHTEFLSFDLNDIHTPSMKLYLNEDCDEDVNNSMKYINSIYDQDKSKVHLLFKNYEFSGKIHNNNNFYDFIVMALEIDDNIILQKYSKSVQSKCLEKWFKHLHKRSLILSNSIIDLLSHLNLTFISMKYVLYHDRLDIFKILVQNMEFTSIIRSELFMYMSPQIISYILEQSEFERMDYPIEINYDNISHRSYEELESTWTLMKNKMIKILKFNFISFSNGINVYDKFVGMYFKLQYMYKLNPNGLTNFIKLLNMIIDGVHIFNFDFDMVIIKLFYENHINKDDRLKNFDILINLKYKLNSQSSTADASVFQLPDLEEIKDELMSYNACDPLF